MEIEREIKREMMNKIADLKYQLYGQPILERLDGCVEIFSHRIGIKYAYDCVAKYGTPFERLCLWCQVYVLEETIKILYDETEDDDDEESNEDDDEDEDENAYEASDDEETDEASEASEEN